MIKEHEEQMSLTKFYQDIDDLQFISLESLSVIVWGLSKTIQTNWKLDNFISCCFIFFPFTYICLKYNLPRIMNIFTCKLCEGLLQWISSTEGLIKIEGDSSNFSRDKIIMRIICRLRKFDRWRFCITVLFQSVCTNWGVVIVE